MYLSELDYITYGLIFTNTEVKTRKVCYRKNQAYFFGRSLGLSAKSSYWGTAIQRLKSRGTKQNILHAREYERCIFYISGGLHVFPRKLSLSIKQKYSDYVEAKVSTRDAQICQSHR